MLSTLQGGAKKVATKHSFCKANKNDAGLLQEVAAAIFDILRVSVE